jgi:hypothetical protein
MTFASIRSRTTRVVLVTWLPLAGAAAYACGGTNAAVIPDDDAGTDAALDGTVPVDGSLEDAGAEATTAIDASDAGSCDPGVYDDSAGMFVAPDGTDSVSCGSRATPCHTIQAAIERARGIAEKNVVYVARGTYVEHLVLYAGFRVEGGWSVRAVPGADPEWRVVCNNRSTATVVKAPVGFTETVLADTLGGSAELSTLAIESKDIAGPGETLYGVVARHPSTQLTLVDVIVTVRNGGAGVAGSGGAIGVNGDAGCASSDAGNGFPPGTTGEGADAGAIGLFGFTPAAGASGTAGTPGNAGLPGQPGSCVDCVSCSGIAICNAAPAGTSCGTGGTSGCGGGPGSPGLGGSGGGSSIALYTWDAQVTILRGALRSGNGGAGGSGGLGGDGGSGGPGFGGQPGTACATACNGGCNDTAFKAGDAGDRGTNGGVGSYGGRGGGGAGGWSYAIVRGTSAQVTTSPATGLIHGNGGPAGPPNGGPGPAGDRYP